MHWTFGKKWPRRPKRRGKGTFLDKKRRGACGAPAKWERGTSRLLGTTRSHSRFFSEAGNPTRAPPTSIWWNRRWMVLTLFAFCFVFRQKKQSKTKELAERRATVFENRERRWPRHLLLLVVSLLSMYWAITAALLWRTGRVTTTPTTKTVVGRRATAIEPAEDCHLHTHVSPLTSFVAVRKKYMVPGTYYRTNWSLRVEHFYFVY